MPDLKDLNNLYLIAAFIVPGLIITYIRSRFISGRMEKLADSVLAYFTLSLIYYGLMVPAIGQILSVEPGLTKTLLWWALIFLGPFVFGLLLGVATQRDWLRWIAIRLRLRMVHDTPTSWDWQFANCQTACCVMVTLTDGSTVAGIFGTKSFASTDPAERDIYIEEVVDVAEDGVWAYRKEPAGILIMAKEIRYVEFKQGF